MKIFGRNEALATLPFLSTVQVMLQAYRRFSIRSEGVLPIHSLLRIKIYNNFHSVGMEQ